MIRNFYQYMLDPREEEIPAPDWFTRTYCVECDNINEAFQAAEKFKRKVLLKPSSTVYDWTSTQIDLV